MFYITVLKPVLVVPRSPVGGSLLPKIGNATGALQLGNGITISVGKRKAISYEVYRKNRFILTRLFEIGYIEIDQGEAVKAKLASEPVAEAEAAPVVEAAPEPKPEVAKPKPGEDLMLLKKDELQAMCDEHGLEYEPNWTKAKLVELLHEASVE